MLVAVGRGHEHLDVLADDLVGAVAEEALAGGIEHEDRPCGIDEYDPVYGRINHRMQASVFAAVRHGRMVPAATPDLAVKKENYADS
jgi:hypothetical protein